MKGVDNFSAASQNIGCHAVPIVSESGEKNSAQVSLVIYSIYILLQRNEMA